MTGAGRLIEDYPRSMASCPESASDESFYCPFFHHTIEVLGRRWNGAILQALRCGVDRFGNLRDGIPGLSDRLLTQRLRELEGEGLIERTEEHGQVRYELSEAGRAMGPVLDALETWVHQWSEPSREPAS